MTSGTHQPSGLKALIIGATGLVGQALLDQLLSSPAYDQVVAFVRRPLAGHHPKLVEELVDFNAVNQWENRLQGDVLFCCLGTTLRQAGTKEEQWKVDYDYQYKVAMAAHFNGVRHVVLISSLGANPDSVFFYTRMKGALEQALSRLNFPLLTIAQPASLTGARSQPRAGEAAAVKVLHLANRLGLFRKYRPIPAEVVAKALLNLSLRPSQPSQLTVAGPNLFVAAEKPSASPGTN